MYGIRNLQVEFVTDLTPLCCLRETPTLLQMFNRLLAQKCEYVI